MTNNTEIINNMNYLKLAVVNLLEAEKLLDEKINILLKRIDKLEQNTRKNWRF